MIILGIDPGLANCGYGLLEVTRNRDIKALHWGAVRTAAQTDGAERLGAIYAELKTLHETYAPDAVAMEELFFARNVTSAMKVGEVIGVIKLLAHERGIPLSGYTPLQIKQTIACYGRADKVQMQRMVQLILGLRELPKPNHAADALAVAVCHANSSRLAQLVRAS